MSSTRKKRMFGFGEIKDSAADDEVALRLRKHRKVNAKIDCFIIRVEIWNLRLI